MPETLYLIDLFSLVFQVFHAIPEMTSPSGQPTNAIFGFTRDLLNIFKAKQPTHLLCAVDSSGPGTREALYAAYKANRSEMPQELRAQIPFILETLAAFGIPAIEFPGWEADDVIATVVEQAAQRDMDVCIVSNDKDVRQLLGPRVRAYNVRKDNYLGEAELLAEWGVRPDQVVDYQSLVGDPVDNVPGIPLVGPKKASALLQQFGTLEEVLARADQAPGAKLRENLKTFADQARVSRQLVALKRDLPLVVDWEAARVGKLNAAQLTDLFTRFGFRRFSDEVRAMHAGEVQQQPSTQHGFTFDIIDTPEKLYELLGVLQPTRQFCLDLETTGLDPVRADIVGWAISWQDDKGFYIPVQGPPGQRTLDPRLVVDSLRPVLEHPDVLVTNQNIKYDMLVLRRAGIRLRGIGMDPMVGDYLLDAGARSHSLDELARKYVQHEMIPITDLIGKGLFQIGMQEVDIPKVAEYAAEDAVVAWKIAGLVGDALRAAGLWKLYWDLERPLIEILVEMQQNGICVDAGLLQSQSAGAGARLVVIQQQIHGLAGHEFNIDSPVQLRQVLFSELKLPVLRKTKTGASTDQDVLEQLAAQHPLPAKILEHRRLSKLKGTYLDALPQMVNPETGRIHCSFNQVVAATGRLSSSEPNLQNIPIRTEEGRRVRQAFVAPNPDWKLLCADYSQVELRMLAHFSRDPALLAAFESGIDVHTAVAAEVFGVELSAVDAQMRAVAKAVNFGVIYGQSPFGLATSLGISKGAAAEFIDGYFARYAGVDAYLQRLLEECVKTGYATTILGRRRTISGIQSTTGRQRNLPERTAINTVIQGSAADLIKQAMINVHRRLRAEGHPGKMLLQIHDELVFEVPNDRLSDLSRLVREEMESALPLEVPLKVDLSAGADWGSVEPLATGEPAAT